MRPTISESISCRKNMFLLKFSNKNTYFPHEMDKLMVVLMSIKRLNKERQLISKGNFAKLTKDKQDFCKNFCSIASKKKVEFSKKK